MQESIQKRLTREPGIEDVHTRGRLGRFFSDGKFSGRIYPHVTLVFLLLLTVSLAGLRVPTIREKTPLSSLQLVSWLPSASSEEPAPAEEAASAPLPVSAAVPVNDGYIIREALPHTEIPQRGREEVNVHVVQGGDTIFSIADAYGIRPETIMWSNQTVENNPDLLMVGQELIIIPVDGVYHQAGESDTISGIASTYKVEPETIIDYPPNHFDPDNPTLTPGEWVIVPGGTKPFIPRKIKAYEGPIPEDAAAGTGSFGWPASGQLTQAYWGGHRAVDIGGWKGAPVIAADSGFVSSAGWDDTGYGRVVVIDHQNGYQTLYAHLQVYYVEAGDSVAKGEQIATMGSTGNSTGPHLHFEIIQNGVRRNPLGFLP
jgi:murein DD-endopeptidase MepM/ murein hydrolase activator NlpD